VNGRPRVWPVFVGFAVVFVVLQTAGAVVLGVWAYATMPPDSGGNGLLARLEDLVSSPPGLSVAALLSAIGLGVSASIAAALSPVPWRRRLRLTMEGVTAGRVALVVLGLLAVSQALESCIALLGLSRFGTLNHLNRVMASASGVWLAVLMVAVALGPGIAEELFFRGYMQTRLSERYGSVAAIAAASACFGFMHFDLVHSPVAAVLGVFLGWAVERIGSIVPAMAAHVVNNLVAVLSARWSLAETIAGQVAVLAVAIAAVGGVVYALQRSCPLAAQETPQPGDIPASL
jgi:membrane protease YdiL (CAAX protease family)